MFSNDPADRPEPMPERKAIPGLVLDAMMKRYEGILDRAITLTGAATDDTTPNYDLVAAVTADQATFNYLASMATNSFLERQLKEAFGQLRQNVEGSVQMAQMLGDAARAAKAARKNQEEGK